MQCMLWSDPHDEEGWKTSDRGAGVLWGPDLTKKFLTKNSFEFVIRSHEMVEEGTKLLHDDRVMTLFSASNYTGTNENQGAVVSFANQKGLCCVRFSFACVALVDVILFRCQRLSSASVFCRCYL